MNIKLGNIVRDVTSGFSGTATQSLESLNGNVQVAIQPQMDEGSKAYPDAMFIDHHMIDVVEEGIANRVTLPAPVFTVLGEEVCDKVTGFKGTTTMKATYINGCVSFFVEPKFTGFEKDKIEGRWLDHGRLESVSRGVVDVVKPAEASANGKVPGGPARRVEKRW